MFRKILTAVLCLMLALAMPLTSLAATDIALKIIPGAELASADASIKTIFDNLFLRLILEDESGLVALESDKGEVISAGMRADEQGFYVASALLGNRVLYFSAEEVSAFMIEIMRQTGADEATIAQMEQSLAQLSGQPAANAITGSSFNGMMFDDDALENMTAEELYANDPAMLQFVKNMEEKMVVTQGEFTDAAFNTATTKTEVVMTRDDMMLIFDSEMVKEMYGSMAQASGMTADELLAMVKDVFNQLDMTYNIVTYTNGDDLCAMQMDMFMKGDVTMEVTDTTGKTSTETETIDMTMDMDMNVLTTGDVDNMDITTTMTNNASANAETIGFDMNVAADDNADTVAFDGNLTENEQTVMLFQGAFAEGEDDAVNGWVGILAENQQITFTLTGKETNDVYDALISVYARGEATAIVEPTWSDSAIVSVAIRVQETQTPALINALNNATPETSVQLLQMSQEELFNEINAISGDAIGALFTGLGNLPSELYSMVMNLLGEMTSLIPMQ